MKKNKPSTQNSFKIKNVFQRMLTIFLTLFCFTLTAEAQNFQGTESSKISEDFPYESKFVEVRGSKMHYVEIGQGDPILFLHGNPTSSYLWRNILPYLEKQGRVIAVDNIGFGKSDKPDIDYSFKDHIKYLDEFIKKLKLKNITLVVHDWGSALGLNYAANNESNVKGIAMMEVLIPPFLPIKNYESIGEGGKMFKIWRETKEGKELLINQNILIEQILPSSIIRKLSLKEMDAYRAPFIKEFTRKSIWMGPKELPIAENPKFSFEKITYYSKWLMESSIPKLHIYASPGVINPPQIIDYLKTKLKNYETSFIGKGLHYIQEDEPEAIGRALSDLYRRLEEK